MERCWSGVEGSDAKYWKVEGGRVGVKECGVERRGVSAGKRSKHK